MEFQKRQIGQTAISVDVLGVGSAPLGGNFASLSYADGRATIEAARAGGVGFVDTAPFYGYGRSERLVGDALRGQEYRLSTKVGRMLVPGPNPDGSDNGMIDPLPFYPVYDYSYDAVMRSFEDSLQRLGLDRIDMLLVHDIGEMTHGPEENARHWRDLCNGGYRALDELRTAGLVGAIGMGVNEAQVCRDALQMGAWDVFLLAGRYTLLEQDPLGDLLPECEKAGCSIIVGGPFNSGILVGREMWNYAKAPENVVNKAKALADICAAHNVDLPAAALQFPLAHKVVASVIPGSRSAAEYRQILAWAAADIPAEMWTEMVEARLILRDAPLPRGNPFMEAQ